MNATWWGTVGGRVKTLLAKPYTMFIIVGAMLPIVLTGVYYVYNTSNNANDATTSMSGSLTIFAVIAFISCIVAYVRSRTKATTIDANGNKMLDIMKKMPLGYILIGVVWFLMMISIIVGTAFGGWFWINQGTFWVVQIAVLFLALSTFVAKEEKGLRDTSMTIAGVFLLGVFVHTWWEYAYFAENQRNAEAQAKLRNMVYGEKGNPFLPRIPPNGPLEVVVTRTKHDFNYHPRVPVAFDVTHSMGDTFIMTFEMKGEKEFVPVTFSGDGNVTLPRGFYRIREIWTEGEKEQVSVTFNFATVDT